MSQPILVPLRVVVLVLAQMQYRIDTQLVILVAVTIKLEFFVLSVTCYQVQVKYQSYAIPDTFVK